MAKKNIEILHGILERQAETNADLQTILSDDENQHATDIARLIADNARTAADVQKLLQQYRDESIVDLSADF